MGKLTELISRKDWNENKKSKIEKLKRRIVEWEKLEYPHHLHSGIASWLPRVNEAKDDWQERIGRLIEGAEKHLSVLRSVAYDSHAVKAPEEREDRNKLLYFVFAKW